MQEINVEEIMQKIREEIKNKGYTSDMLSFSDVETPSEEGYSYNYEELCRLVYQVNQSCSVAWVRELPGNPIVVFIKKIIRTLAAFLIAPMSDDQNVFNGSATRVINQLMGYINMQNGKIEEMERNMDLLEEKVARLADSGQERKI